MHIPRSGSLALVLGVAAWAQLALAPAVAARGVDAASVACALAALVALAAAAVVTPRDATRGATLALAVFPAALGVTAVVVGRHAVPRFDAPSRVLAALTTVGYLTAVVALRRDVAVVVPATRSGADDRDRAPPPAFQRASMACLTAVAAFVAVVAPAWTSAREPDTVAERVAGEALLRGRAAMVTAVGTLLAVALVLQGGGALLRASPPRPRAASRALAYVLWAACAWVMRRWLDHSR